ncbi:hypothetical protein M426DRAFT_160654 [Hypoxylon sp. CI-4A]|nr:hypothetical protein M426DRAFT_160654 [Hypoxylon sp. CI-4A]
MESQPNSTVATPTSAPAAPSPIPPKAPSPVNPVHNPSTHYPNGLPLSINGLSRGNGNGNGNGINGNGSASPATGPASTGTTTPSAPSPAVATATAAAAAATTASRPVSGPVPRPTLTKTPTPTPTLPPIAAAPLKPMIIYTPSQPPTMATPRRQTLPRQPSSGSAHKVSIVDPPGSYSRGRSHPNSQSSSQGFPSPRREHELENPKFLDDQSRLTHAMQQSVPAAVRRVIRDNWEKCLLGSEFHHAFLVSHLFPNYPMFYQKLPSRFPHLTLACPDCPVSAVLY